MCGINGFAYNFKNITIARKSLEKMNYKIFHRGPDEDGFFLEREGKNTIGLAMRRLSIIDLSSGKQPIFTDDKNKIIVFNGEIYNYRELKKHLIAKGINFRTHSDTEVILKIYENYGVEGFKMLDGMFAFSIYDKIKKKIFIARDFFGEKPLYYTQTKKGLIWASELKSIISIIDKRPNISNDGLNLFFQLTYIPAPFSIYEGIYKLEANHYITYDIETDRVEIKKIHSEERKSKDKISFEEAKDTVRSLVEKSVESRSISDVPLGTFLSGGVDSSIVSLCLSKISKKKINTFSIGFDKKSFDETDKSRLVANLIGSNHHEFIITEKNLTTHIEDILLNFDEPFADSSALPSFLVAHKTREFVKVALTGDGGDEVFGGYNKYTMGAINSKYTKLVPSGIHSNVLKIIDFLTRQKSDLRGLRYKINKAVKSIDYQDDFYFNIIKLGYNDYEIKRFLNHSLIKDSLNFYKEKLPLPTNLSDFRLVDKSISLEGDMLVKVDRTSMLTSLECRAPFLNRELWEYTLSLPENYLQNGSEKKIILKKAFEDDFPSNFLEKSKRGFGVPVGDWLRYGMKEELLSYIDKDFLYEQNIFNSESIRLLVTRHVNSDEDNSFKVWTFYCFQKWYKNIYLNL